jgi:hypothetical protein
MNPNPIKYTYHSSQPQAHYQPYSHSQISMENQNASNQYRPNQPSYQYNQSYLNINPNNHVNNYNNGQNVYSNGHNVYSAQSSHNIGPAGGYQFSQYHMNNNYAPQYSHNDEQLLEDLPGDENMQRLF